MKKMLALILTAILTASAFAIPASAVEITDPDVLAECKTYAEEVKAYIADRGRNDNLSKLYFSYRDYQDPISQPVQYDIPTTWRTVAEYKVGKQTRYYIVARDDEEGLCNVWSGSDVSGNPNEDAGKILDYYATLVYDYETGEVSTVESDLTPNDVEARKTLIEETILPYFTANSDKAPIRVYALQTDEDTVQCLVAYQSNNETYCRRVQYDIETEKVSMPASNVISANSYDPILVNSNTVVYDCAFKTAKINTFTGTYVFDSETEVSESNPEPAPAPTAPSTSVITPEPVKDGWEKSGTSWLYYDNGQQVKNDWVKDQSKWYYMDPDGVMVTGWQTIAGKKYYLSDSGVMQTGWKQIDGSWYYFKGSGEIATGWLQITSGSPWYYLKSDGKMVTGWMQIDGKWYCFSNESGSLGTMYANTTTPDGVKVGSDGAMIKEGNSNTSSTENSNTTSSENKVNTQEERAYRDAGYAIAHFRKQLKNPNSLILRLISSTMYDNGLTAVFAEISGMNSLGGYASDTFIAYVYDGKVYEVYAYDPIQDKVEETRNVKGEHMSLDCDKALTYEP